MRAGQENKAVINEGVIEYGNFIWALAQRMTASNEEAEAATQEIFLDLWRYAKRAERPRIDDKMIGNLIVRQRLIRYSRHTE